MRAAIRSVQDIIQRAGYRIWIQHTIKKINLVGSRQVGEAALSGEEQQLLEKIEEIENQLNAKQTKRGLRCGLSCWETIVPVPGICFARFMQIETSTL